MESLYLNSYLAAGRRSFSVGGSNYNFVTLKFVYGFDLFRFRLTSPQSVPERMVSLKIPRNAHFARHNHVTIQIPCIEILCDEIMIG